MRSHPLLIIAFITFILAGACTRDDSEERRKEELTFLLNGDINADSLKAHVQWLQNMGTRFALAGNRRNVAVSIRNRFRNMGYDDAWLDSFVVIKTYRGTPYQLTQYNVIASLKPESESDSVCIIGGHYDSILNSGDPFAGAPGANDNASGVAAALEIARVMKKNDYIPENEIRFVAFGCEELGLNGSIAYATDALHSLQKIMFMLNNDMIAYEPSTDNTSWRVNIIDYQNSRFMREEASRLCRKFTKLIPYNSNTYSNSSDSYPFFVNGYKALFFFSDIMDPAYHSLNDVVANCNFEYCREIVKLNCAILVDRN